MLHRLVSSQWTCCKQAVGLGERHSPRFPAWGETKGELASPTSFCLMEIEALCCWSVSALAQGWTLAAGVWAVLSARTAGAPSTPLTQSHPSQHPEVPKHQPGRRCPCPSQAQKKSKLYLQKSNMDTLVTVTENRLTKTQSKHTHLFTCYVRLCQRFLFALQYQTGRISCFTACGQFKYSLYRAHRLPVTAMAEQVLKKLFAC